MLLLFLGVAFPLMAYSQKQVPEFSTAGFFNDPQLRTVYNFNPAWRFFKGRLAEQNALILMIRIGNW